MSARCVVCKTEGDGRLCSECRRENHGRLTEFPELYVELELSIAAGGQAGEPVSGTRNAPIPIRADVIDMQTDLAAFLLGWELTARRLARHSRRQQSGRLGRQLDAAVRYLDRRFDALVDEEPVFCRGIDSWYRKARRALQLTRVVHRLPAPCPSCGRVTLIRLSGDDAVRCANCHLQWREDEYERLVRVLAYELREQRKAASL